MELADRMLVDRYMPQNHELRSLIESHSSYERDIEDLSGRSWLSDVERQRLRILKKQKLRGRDRIEEILRGYRVQVAHG